MSAATERTSPDASAGTTADASAAPEPTGAATDATGTEPAAPNQPPAWSAEDVLKRLEVKPVEAQRAMGQPASIIVPLLAPATVTAVSALGNATEVGHAFALGEQWRTFGDRTGREVAAETLLDVAAATLEYERDLPRLFPAALAYGLIGLDADTIMAVRARKYAEWLQREPTVTVTRAALVAHALLVDPDVHPADRLLSPKKDAKTLLSALAQHVRTRLGLSAWASWGQALSQAADEWWWTGEEVGLTVDLATEYGKAAARNAELELRLPALEKEVARLTRLAASATADVAAGDAAREQQLQTLAAERDAARREAADAVREAAELRSARDRARARAEQLEEQLRAAGLEPGAKPDEPEPEPAAPEPVAAAPAAPMEPEFPPMPEQPLEGRTVFLFTGHQRGVAVQQMQQGFEALGAEVRAFQTREQATGPERYPADVLVVCDVRFMPHKVSEVLKARAKASGSWIAELRHGAQLAREAAERWWRDQHRASA